MSSKGLLHDLQERSGLTGKPMCWLVTAPGQVGYVMATTWFEARALACIKFHIHPQYIVAVLA